MPREDITQRRAPKALAMKGTLAVTGSAEADELVNKNPLALLVALLLDQQVQ